MFTCSTLLLFPYPVPADIHGSVQQVTLESVPVDVLQRLFLWFSPVKYFECRHIRPPQEVQCVHMYSVAWDLLVICANHYLTETGWELAGGGSAVAQMCGELCAGELCGGTVCGSCVGGTVLEKMWAGGLWGVAVCYSYFVSLIGFIHGSFQHVTLWHVPVNVLPRLFLWFSQAKHLACHDIEPPQEVQCVHMYSVAWDALVICTNHYFTETGWELGRGGGGAVWGKLWGARESCGGEGVKLCWELCPSIVGKVMWGRCARGGTVLEKL